MDFCKHGHHSRLQVEHAVAIKQDCWSVLTCVLPFYCTNTCLMARLLGCLEVDIYHKINFDEFYYFSN